jgi:hypothetical protein
VGDVENLQNPEHASEHDDEDDDLAEWRRDGNGDAMGTYLLNKKKQNPSTARTSSI